MASNSPDREPLIRAAVTAGPDCFSIEELGQFADNDLAVRDRAAIAAHLKQCPRCSTELALLAEFRAEPPVNDADSRWIAHRLESRAPEIFAAKAGAEKVTFFALLRGFFSPGFIRPLSLAAAGLLIVAAAGLYLRRAAEPPLSTAVDNTWRGTQVEIVSPIGDLERVPETFRWQPVPGAVRYEISVSEVDGTELWNASTSSTLLPVPAELAGAIRPAKTLLWKVTAINAKDVKIAESPASRFRLVKVL